MRIIRFLGDDHQVHFGIPDSFPTAREAAVVHDPLGVLGAVDPLDAAVRRHEIFGGKRALVADDDGNMRELMSTVLAKAGCECCLCQDGAEAVRMLENEVIDLVVSDVVMPHFNGYEIFSAAKEVRGDLPVVLVTGFGYDPGHALVRATGEGLSTVLYKPFTPQQLLDEVERAIRDAFTRPAEALVNLGETMRIERILAPLVPTTILCVGRNWKPVRATSAPVGLVAGAPNGHAKHGHDDGERPASEALEVFMKPRSAIQDPGGPIRLPDFDGVDPRLACEGEVAVVIGRGGSCIEPEDVSRHVLGYTAAIDVTARHFQTAAGPPLWMRGKGFDTFCPLGPAIVTGEEVDPADLNLRTFVNNRTIREGSTRDMVHPVDAVVCEVSRHVTLEPGMVILTGAPPLADSTDEFDPEADLRAGDRVRVEIDGLGELRHVVQAD